MSEEQSPVNTLDELQINFIRSHLSQTISEAQIWKRLPDLARVPKHDFFLTPGMLTIIHQSNYCQAQVKPQLQLCWPELSLISNSSPTTHPGKFISGLVAS